ncbi:Y4yA family PLP-dependent enzyme [soil metagenome]
MSVASETTALRDRCAGVAPLSARLEPWMADVCSRPAELTDLMARHGSPVNLINPSPMARNATELSRAARDSGLDLGIYFARKANKALGLVDRACEMGIGIDLASERELTQVLERGVAPARLTMTAAIKPRALLERCAETGTLIVVDNADELRATGEAAHAVGAPDLPIALRLAPDLGPDRIETRFGLASERWLATIGTKPESPRALRVEGVHFHIDGYDAGDRITALIQAIDLIDALRASGHQPRFVDIGGGIPIDYLDDAEEWSRFQAQHLSALRDERAPLTFENHGLGLTIGNGEIAGRLNAYPVAQRPIRGEWLAQILRSSGRGGGSTLADSLRERELELRCEPGRSLLDGCGMTVARVEFRKQRRDGTWLIGLAMNRTQCRSTADEFPLDPLLLREDATSASATGTDAIEGYLVGAYCIERELLSWRLMRFPSGAEVGDLIAFPNTGGYMMHILESASHQIPLAKNLLFDGERFTLDPIDRPAD